MKHLFLAIILLLGAVSVNAQVTSKQIVFVTSDPSTCSGGKQYNNTTSGDIFERLGTSGTTCTKIVAASGGSLTVGTTTIANGTDTRVLFQDGTTVGEDAGITYDKTTDSLTVAGALLATVGVVTGGVAISGFATVTAPSDGVMLLTNGAQSDFSRLQFGGTTSSFPSIKRSSAALAFRVADDSVDAAFTASGGTLSSATVPLTFSNAAFQSCTSLGSSAGGVLTCTASTAKVKQGFQFFSGGLDVIRKIQPQTFQYRPETVYADGGKTHLGLIAENLQSANPLLVSATRAGMLQPEPLAIQAVLIDAVKTLDARLTQLEAENKRLRRQVQKLRRH